MIDLDMKINGYQEILRFCTHFNAYKRHSKIHSDEIDALLYISTSKNEVTPLMLADYFNVSKPRITKIINQLIQQKDIEKKPSTKDGRSHILLLSTQGKEKLKAVQNEYYDIIDEFINELGFGDFIQLTTLLTKANETI